MLSGYTLTFAAFMLVAGRLADITHPKPIFCIGYGIVGLFSIPVAASVHPIMSIVFRAVQGVGAAMNVPSSISLLLTYFPEPVEQGRALAIFGASGSLGNISGFIIAGALAADVSWRWSKCSAQQYVDIALKLRQFTTSLLSLPYRSPYLAGSYFPCTSYLSTNIAQLIGSERVS